MNLHRHVTRAGPKELRKLAAQHPEVSPEAEETLAAAAAEEADGQASLDKLYGTSGQSPSRWKTTLRFYRLACAVIGAVALLLAWFVNTSTMTMDPSGVLGVALGLPLVLIFAKLGDVFDKLPDPKELPQANVNAIEARNRSAVITLLLTLVFAVAKMVPALPFSDQIAWLSLAGLELSLCFLLVACLGLFFQHRKGPAHLAEAKKKRAEAMRLGAIVDRFAEESQESAPKLSRRTTSYADVVDPHQLPSAEPKPAQLPEPGTKATPRKSNPRKPAQPRREVREAVTEALEDDEDLSFWSEGDDAPGSNGSSPVAPFASAVIASLFLLASTANAMEQFPVIVDKSPSIREAEVIDIMPVIAKRVASHAAQSEEGIEVTLYLWDGSPEGSRLPTKRWVIQPVLLEPCRSPFPLRCKWLKEQAMKRAAELRRPVLDEIEQTISKAGDASVTPSGASCISSALLDAQGYENSVVVTDAVLFCKQQFLPAKRGVHTLVVVLGSGTDGPELQERLAKRIALLRSLGYDAIDAQALRRLDGRQLFPAAPGK